MYFWSKMHRGQQLPTKRQPERLSVRMTGRQVRANHCVTLPGNETVYSINAGQLGNVAAQWKHSQFVISLQFLFNIYVLEKATKLHIVLVRVWNIA